MTQRATKIVATIGPASSSREVLHRMIEAGVNVVRLNFSHGKAADHVASAALVREVAAACGREIAIMADLQGPKIRIGKFKDGKITLEKGDHFILDASCDMGDQTQVGLDYKELPADLKPADVLLLNDGLIVLVVDRIAGSQIFTTVKIGGELSNNKGINRQGGGLSAPALTGKDMEDIQTAMLFDADYVAVSFPKSATDMIMARQLATIAGQARGHKPQMIAKMEDVAFQAKNDQEEIAEAMVSAAMDTSACAFENLTIESNVGSIQKVDLGQGADNYNVGF
jgi:pyruvate kinase